MFELELLEAEVEKNLFLVSLIGATIQDGSKRERFRMVVRERGGCFDSCDLPVDT